MPIESAEPPAGGGLAVFPGRPKWPGNRAGLRLAAGVAAVFSLAIVVGWPLGYVAAVFTSILLFRPTPVAPRSGAVLVLASLAILCAIWLVGALLVHYPLLFLAASGAGVVAALAITVHRGNQVLATLSLISVLLVAVSLRSGSGLAPVLVIWMPLNMLIALAASWLAFGLVPPERAAVVAAARGTPPQLDPGRKLLRLSLVSLPLVLVFLLIEGGALITLVYAGMLTQQLAIDNDSTRSYVRQILVANLVGGMAAIAAFWIIAIAPNPAVLAIVSGLLCLSLAGWWIDGGAETSLVQSSFAAALIVLGGSLAPSGEEAQIRLIVRVLQILAAMLYLLLALVAVDTFLPERPVRPKLPNWKRRAAPTAS